MDEQSPRRETTPDSTYQRLTDKLQVRGQNFYALLRCPVTGAPLTRQGDTLVSEADPTLTYPIDDSGMVQLATPAQLTEFAAAEQTITATFAQKSWPAMPIEEFRRLPQTTPTDWPPDYWQARANVTADMWRILENIRREQERLPIGPMGTAVDFSSGMGWLGYGLDVSGYNTIVLSQLRGSYGLGLFPYSRYLRVFGSLQAPPLTPDSFDLVTFSFSLHLIEDQNAALQNAATLLKADGTLVILSVQAFALSVVKTTLENAGLRVETQSVRGIGNPLTRTLRSFTGAGKTPPLLIARKG